MTEYCLKPELVFSLLDEVSRHRALLPHESDILQDLIEIDAKPFRWNPRLETQLVLAASSPGGIRRFAERIGIAHGTAIVKLHRLRKCNERKIAKAKKQG